MSRIATRILGVPLIFVLAALLVAKEQEDEIVVGMSGEFTWTSKGLGIELYRGSMAYFEHVNSKGGVHGRKIVIKAYDDGYNPGPAIENTIRLIEKTSFFAFNFVGTPTTSRCLPLLKRHADDSFLLFFPFSGASPQRRAPYGKSRSTSAPILLSRDRRSGRSLRRAWQKTDSGFLSD